MATTWTRQSINSANQVVSSSSSTTEWSRLQIVSSAGGGNLTINDVNYITDSSGTGSLLNIDSIERNYRIYFRNCNRWFAKFNSHSDLTSKPHGGIDHRLKSRMQKVESFSPSFRTNLHVGEGLAQ